MGLSGTLDQNSVSAPTPISPTVMPPPTIPKAESIEIAPNAEFAPLVSNTPNKGTILPAPLTLASALDQDSTTSSGAPPISSAHDTHDAPPAAGQKL